MKKINKNELITDLKKIGLKSGDALNLKISLKSIGYVEGGANTFVEAIKDVVGPDGVLVVEAFIKSKPWFKLLNKKDYVDTRTAKSYTGLVANAVQNHPEAILTDHPIHRFAIIGNKAEEIAQKAKDFDSTYSVLKVLIDMGGYNLRIGGLDKVTGVGTTHVVIDENKIHQKRVKMGVNYFDHESQQVKTSFIEWAGGCPTGFNELFPFYRENNAIISEGKVGEAEAMITDMRMTYNIESEIIGKDPKVLLCSDKGCPKCYVAWDFYKSPLLKVICNNLKNRNYRQILYSLIYSFSKTYYPRK